MSIDQSAFESLNSKNPKEKYGFVKELLLVGKKQPEVLYIHLPQILNMLDSEKNIIIWAGIVLLGDIIKVDVQHNVRLQLTRIYSYLKTGKMITANHTVTALSKIAEVEIELQNEIVREILKTKEYTYDTEECKNIVFGNVITSMERIYLSIKDDTVRREIKEFVEAQVSNTRNGTRKKAERFLKTYSKERNI